LIDGQVKPNPSAIGLCSPTLAKKLDTCGYMVAFSRDQVFDGLDRPNMFSSLGSASHALIEKAHRGFFNDVPEEELGGAVSAQWDIAIESENALLVSAWAPSEPPLLRDWRGYQITRSKTRKRVLKDIRRFRENPGSGGRGPVVEQRLEDSEKGLRGKPDRIEWHQGVPVVVDVKAGLEQEGIRPDQRRQLLFYAHLVNIVHGVAPQTIVVESPGGERWSSSVGVDEVEELVKDVERGVQRFNDCPEGEHERLARPSKVACQYCPFRTYCKPFWAALRVGWGQHAVSGHVRSAREEGDGQVVVIDVKSPIDWPGKKARIPPQENLQAGQRVSVIDAKPITVGALGVRWNTQVTVFPLK
jgi:CRISPR/Cas system-associated exonuclease Cas4 (RecB family)